MKMLVLGAGLQGSACAFDLLQNDDVTEVRLADLRVDRLPAFLAPYIGKRLVPVQLDLRDKAATLPHMQACDAVMSAAPYYLNRDLAEWAIEGTCHFSDLGGNTDIVFEQKALHDRAVAAGVSVVPDCGVAPGMVNILAQHGIERLDTVDAVRIYVGGLPQHPEPPLNYQIVYSLEGVLDYYTTLSWIIRDGRRTQVKALSEIVPVEFPAPLGTLEAFHTAGGLSTLGFRYEGKIPTMEYKTLRYPGHAKIMEAIRDLGLLDLEPIRVKGAEVRPRDVAVAAMGPRLTRPEGRDLVALRVSVSGTKAGKPATIEWNLVDRYDEQHGISAMMRCTGYSLAITGLMQVRQEVAGPGVLTPDEAMPGAAYIGELAKRGVRLVEAGVRVGG
ncbi:MAG: saccharopine dehydrogenase NADP-binding domain-containing protein [Gemmatimonadaceae bacterium]|nr:saccharopine dehydrogenase NADP-binding domain-containing protein [Gemmatimonadaceae bacterium]